MIGIDPRDNLVVVLYRPQKLVNIGGVVRAMKNMGLRRLRLVEPGEYDPADITGIAHRSDDILAGVQIYNDLDTALADSNYVIGTTSRQRGANLRIASPRELAPELLARAIHGPVALLFGPEDNGLTNTELDRCHVAVSIPAEPGYASLNLAQAVLIVAYELHLAAELPTPPARREPYPLASATQLETVFETIEQALWAVEFFKSGHAEGILRTLRSLVHRAEPDTREAALLTAICLETSHFLRRSRGAEADR